MQQIQYSLSTFSLTTTTGAKTADKIMKIDPNVMTALVSYEDNADNSVQQMMKYVVSEGSVDMYNSEKILFLIWVFNNDTLSDKLLHD